MLRWDVALLLSGASVLSCGESGTSVATGGASSVGGSPSGGVDASGEPSAEQAGGTSSGGKSSGGASPAAGGASSGGAVGAGGSSSGGGVNVSNQPPSCAPGGPGMDTCGEGDDESCCTSLLVSGGTFFRNYTNGGGGPSGTSAEATISDFRLDKYEVTAARFRQFVLYIVGGGEPPAPGSGKHTHLNDGEGLSAGGGNYEPGWNDDWNSLLSTDIADWTEVLAEGEDASLYGTWTEEPGENDELPITFPSWYEAHAFCIWDGGFLPSEAEWKYAAAGGDEQRRYPWGSDSPSSDNQHLIYDCCFPSGQCSASSGRDTCTGVVNIAPVGSTPQGVGRYGQWDLSGNVWEWNLDAYSAQYDSPCTDCANFDGTDRVMPGGGFHSSMTYQFAYNRQAVNWNPDTYRGDYAVGIRCARAP